MNRGAHNLRACVAKINDVRQTEGKEAALRAEDFGKDGTRLLPVCCSAERTTAFSSIHQNVREARSST